MHAMAPFPAAEAAAHCHAIWKFCLLLPTHPNAYHLHHDKEISASLQHTILRMTTAQAGVVAGSNRLRVACTYSRGNVGRTQLCHQVLASCPESLLDLQGGESDEGKDVEGCT